MKISISELIEALYENYAPRVNGEASYTYGDVIIIDFGFSVKNVEEEDIKYARSFATRLRKKLGSDVLVQQRNCRVLVTPII
jgi:hypothetical protein